MESTDTSSVLNIAITRWLRLRYSLLKLRMWLYFPFPFEKSKRRQQCHFDWLYIFKWLYSPSTLDI